MPKTHKRIQRTDFFLGGEERRKELLAQPECTCRDCNCRGCTACTVYTACPACGLIPGSGGLSNQQGNDNIGWTNFYTARDANVNAQYTFSVPAIASATLYHNGVMVGWSS